MPRRSSPSPGSTFGNPRKDWRDGAPVAAVLVGGAEAGDAAVMEALAGALRRHGLNPLPIPAGRPDGPQAAALAADPPDVVLDGTGAVKPGEFDCPVLDLILPTGGAPAVAGRIEFVAALAARWARLRRTPPAQRRLALLLAGHPDPATAAATVGVLRALAGAGYRVEDLPDDGAALMARLTAGGWRQAREDLPLPDYFAVFHGLSAALRERVTARWGAPERDPRFRRGELHCGGFALSALRFGNVAVGVQPSGDDGDAVPPHGYLAFHAWLQDGLRADAVIHMGGTGGEPPGKAMTLSAECPAEEALGPLPHLHPFIGQPGPWPAILRDMRG